MPGAWTNVDSNFPTITADGNLREQIAAIHNYMYSMTEQLKYTLENLDTQNWNNSAIESFSESFTQKIETVSGACARALSLISELQEKAEALAAADEELKGSLDDLGTAVGNLSEKLLLISGSETEITIGAASRNVNINGNVRINGVLQS